MFYDNTKKLKHLFTKVPRSLFCEKEKNNVVVHEVEGNKDYSLMIFCKVNTR